MVKRILVTSAIAISSLAAQDIQQPTKQLPRFHLDHEGWANMIAVGTITGLDHYSTQRLLARGPRYYEGNSFIVASDGRSVDLKKAMLFDGMQIGLNLLYHGVFKHHVPAKYQWLIRIPMNGAQVYRLKVVVDNLTMK